MTTPLRTSRELLETERPSAIRFCWHFTRCPQLRPSQRRQPLVYSGDPRLGQQCVAGRALCLRGARRSSCSCTRACDFIVGSVDCATSMGTTLFQNQNSTTLSPRFALCFAMLCCALLCCALLSFALLCLVLCFERCFCALLLCSQRRERARKAIRDGLSVWMQWFALFVAEVLGDSCPLNLMAGTDTCTSTRRTTVSAPSLASDGEKCPRLPPSLLRDVFF